jgi:hypothetical protein
MDAVIFGALAALLVWLCCFYLVWAVFVGLRRGYRQVRRMHSIPCTQCRYFTGDTLLKCAVHPTTALTEEAIDCPEFRPRLPGGLAGRPPDLSKR